MTLPQRILSAVDFSETSLRALDVAAQWSRRFDRPLTLAHIFDPAPMGPSAEVPYPAWPSVAASKALEQSARERLTTLAAAKLSDVPHTIAVQGHPNSALGICELASAADLVVVGTQGKTGLERVLMGSVAEQTIRHAPGSVLVVRGHVEPSDFPRRVLVATDFSEENVPALTLAGSVVRAFDARSTVMHALSRRAWKGQLEWGDIDAERLEAAMRTELDALHEKYLAPPVQTAFVVGKSVADAIVRHAERDGTDLLVLATRGRTGLSRLALGSVAEQVTRHAPCSVLVARTQAAAG